MEQENNLFSVVKDKKNDNQGSNITVELTDYEQKLLKYISIEPLHIDEITELAVLPFAKVSEALLSLELKNLIREVEGKRFIRI